MTLFPAVYTDSLVHHIDLPQNFAVVRLTVQYLAKAFMTGLSMAFFELYLPDVEALKAQLLLDGKTQEDIDQLPYSYFKRKCVSALVTFQCPCSSWHVSLKLSSIVLLFVVCACAQDFVVPADPSSFYHCSIQANMQGCVLLYDYTTLYGLQV